MKPSLANLITAVVLIALGLWGYFSSANPSPTAFIPVGFGIVFLLFAKAFNGGNKIVVHIVILLTLFIVIALAMPFKAALGRDDTMAALRVGIMLLTSLGALIIYIKSFIDARRTR